MEAGIGARIGTGILYISRFQIPCPQLKSNRYPDVRYPQTPFTALSLKQARAYILGLDAVSVIGTCSYIPRLEIYGSS